MYNIKLQETKLARKCEIKHWHACGADGREIGCRVVVVRSHFLQWIDFLSYGASNSARD